MNEVTEGTICTNIPKLNELIRASIAKFSVGSEHSLSKMIKWFGENALRIPTGVDFFDEATNGGLYNGITVLAGAPNLGKTTLLVQVAVSLSSKGIPVIYITKDMSRAEIYLKVVGHVSNISGCKNGLAIPEVAEYLNLGGLPEDLKTAIFKRCGNLHIVETRQGANDEFEAILDNALLDEKLYIGKIFQLYCKYFEEIKPVFIIDSLQSIALEYAGTSKEGIDLALSYIKGLQLSYGAPVILVSNLNRASYQQRLSISSLKESGNIEYESSTILGLEAYNGEAPDELRSKDKRKITLKNLKDRVGGYKEVDIEFDAPHSMFRKLSEEGFSVSRLREDMLNYSEKPDTRCKGLPDFGKFGEAPAGENSTSHTSSPIANPRQIVSVKDLLE